MLQNVDSRLDMFLSFSTPLNSYVLSSIEEKDPIPINIYLNDSRMYFNFIFTRVSQRDRTIIESLNPVMVGDVAVITEEIENPILRVIYMNVNSLKTAANGELYVHNGNLTISFRFHSSDISEAGELLKKIVSLDLSLNELRMGRAPGLLKVMDEIDQRIPLSMVTFSYKRTSESEYMVEWKNIPGEPSGALLYDLKDTNSVEDYDMAKELSFPLLTSIFKDHLPLATYLEHHKADSVECIALIPSGLLKPFLVRLYGSFGGIEGFKIDSIDRYKGEKGNLGGT
jgi:hypothetical protein